MHSEHQVQFYESDKYFLDSLSSCIGAGLIEVEVAVIAATKSHLEALEKRLLDLGIDLPEPVVLIYLCLSQ